MKKRGRRKVEIGKVVSSKADKTIVVAVQALAQHPLYRKTVKRLTKLAAHDEKNQAQAGDLVEIMETRPLSKTKRWRLVKVIERAEEPVPTVKEEIEQS